MPIIDYRCRAGHLTTHMIPASKCGQDHPESEHCRCRICKCRAERIYDQAPTIGFTGKSQSSIVVDRNIQTGEYSIPGHREDELPGPGYQRIEITSIRQYEKVRRDIDRSLTEEARIKADIENRYFDQRVQEHRRAAKERIEQAIAKGGHWVESTDDQGVRRSRWAVITPRARKLFDMACRQADRKRAQLRAQRQHQSANFHHRLIEYRSSEQSVVSGTAKRPELPDLRALLERFKR